MSRSCRMPHRAPAFARTACWLAALAVLLALALRPLVLCTGDDGVTHVEFAHAEGECCDHDAWLAAPRDDGHPGTGIESDPGCRHFDLTVDIAPSPTPDGHAAPEHAPTRAFVAIEPAQVVGTGDAARMPPATGPPRPRAFLRRHATVVLQL